MTEPTSLQKIQQAIAMQESLRGVLSDEQVEAALAETTTLQDAKIRVDVSDGVILLSGQVSSPTQRDAAAQRAAGVEGVKRVINELAPPTGS